MDQASVWIDRLHTDALEVVSVMWVPIAGMVVAFVLIKIFRRAVDEWLR